MLLEGKRYYVKDTFDFMIETVGIYKNNKLIKKACQIIKYQLEKILVCLDILLWQGDFYQVNLEITKCQKTLE